MNGIIKRAIAWLAAVITTVIFGIGLQTQNVISRLENLGADVSFTDRLSMTFYDIRYLGSLYVIFVAMAFAVAFLVGGWVFKFTKMGRHFIYSLAGAAAMLVMLLGMKKAFFDVHMIAGAKDSFGIGMQMIAGAIGGFLFARMSQIKPSLSS